MRATGQLIADQVAAVKDGKRSPELSSGSLQTNNWVAPHVCEVSGPSKNWNWAVSVVDGTRALQA